MPKLILSYFVAAAAVGCASVLEAPTETITIATNPDGADCKLSQNGELVARVASTPGTTPAPTGSTPLVVDCTRNGYLPARHVENSLSAGENEAAALLSGLAALAATGKLEKPSDFPERIDIELEADPKLPASLKDVPPIAPVDVSPLAQ
ncbi:MAG: hypothetical protein KTR21_08900 [Rhodobacteraceae bacterium]|nr:hypothetical protein [Paracoccaceae bacterium]